MQPCVFLDRDDTLIFNTTLPPPADPAAGWKQGDLYDPEHVGQMPGALEACRLLKARGYALVIVTNQGCVARGSATSEQVEAVNARVRGVLVGEAGEPLIDGVYFVPFHPKGNVPEYTREHPWRKPGPGMLLAAARDHGLDLPSSWLIGDMPRDCEAGINAGLQRDRCLLCGPEGEHATVLDAAQMVLG